MGFGRHSEAVDVPGQTPYAPHWGGVKLGLRPLVANTVLATIGVLLLIPPRIVEAHGFRPKWLDESVLDSGLHIEVRHPRVIRSSGPLVLTVMVRNLASDHEVTVDGIRYGSEDDLEVKHRRLGKTLPSQRQTFDLYTTTLAEIMEMAELEDVDAVGRLSRRCRVLLGVMSRQAVIDRHQIAAESLPRKPGSHYRPTVEIDLVENGVRRVIRRTLDIPIASPLPNGLEAPERWVYDSTTRSLELETKLSQRRQRGDAGPWYAGDQHLHTTYSLDALLLDGTVEDVTDYATAAELMGLDWIILTDHSNVHVQSGGTDYYTADQFAAGTEQARAYSAGNEMLVLHGQEMGAGQSGAYALPSHYLAYPFASDSTGYLENPSSGLIFGLANCEAEQVIIDRVNSAGGFGFIAHPLLSGTLAFEQWDFDNAATGWSGLEIWTDALGQFKLTDYLALQKWHALLNAIPGPREGRLADRIGFPNAFPVGLAAC